MFQSTPGQTNERPTGAVLSAGAHVRVLFHATVPRSGGRSREHLLVFRLDII